LLGEYMMTRLWTEAELAAHLQVSERTVVRERESGRLKYTRIGTKIRFTEEHIQEYLKAQEGTADPRQKPALAVVRKLLG
jgi:excisionase family DNA binding protein